jgi:hypothetical protein
VVGMHFEVHIWFNDRALAERVAKACRHAIMLSGGTTQKEPF